MHLMGNQNDPKGTKRPASGSLDNAPSAKSLSVVCSENPNLTELLEKPPHSSITVPPPVPTKWHQEPREKLPKDIMRKFLPPHPAERAAAAAAAAAAGEEKKTNRPQTSKGANRGGRGGNQKDRADRPKTAKEGEKTTGTDNRRQQNRGGDRGKRAQDTNSWMYKFHNMERVKYDQVEFTVDTEIPKLPEKDERLKEPVKAEFEAEMGEFDKKIQAMRTERDAIIKKKKQLREGGTLSGTNMTQREALNNQLTEIRKVKEVKNELSRKLKEFHASMDDLEDERTALLKQMHQKYRTVEEVKAGVKELERELTTRTLSSVQEGKMIKEIEALKNA